ncbi:hypothetical protein L6452_40214 [Arctium lappa]|uniref:Uncharacterized protein n=1 Tax=Arctium lappa TaxID=4217 RepID=A0ACB8XLA5_ARCLA|nr:hypothetical protein L6452_40214 [Arctium lappa]
MGGDDSKCIYNLVINAINCSSSIVENVDPHKTMERNIFLGGGSTLFSCLALCLTKQMKYAFDEMGRVRVYEGRGARGKIRRGSLFRALQSKKWAVGIVNGPEIVVPNVVGKRSEAWSASAAASAIYEKGEGLTQVVPIYGGSVVHRGVRTSNFAGGDITDKLEELLGIQNYEFTMSHLRRIVDAIKENYCYVEANPLKENAINQKYMSINEDFQDEGMNYVNWKRM